MNWWGRAASVEMHVEGDTLHIKAAGQRRLFELVLAFVLILVFGASFFHGTLHLVAGTAALMLFPLWRYVRPSRSELLANGLGLTASGNFGWFTLSRKLTLRWGDVRKLEYRSGGDGETGGLYSNTGLLSSKCLLPELDEDQTYEVLTAIYLSFPQARDL